MFRAAVLISFLLTFGAAAHDRRGGVFAIRPTPGYFPSAQPLWQQVAQPQQTYRPPVVWVQTPYFVPVVVAQPAPPPPPEPVRVIEQTIIRVEVPAPAPAPVLPPPPPPVVALPPPPPPEPAKPLPPQTPGNDIFQWLDEEGVQHYSTKVPAEFKARATKIGAKAKSSK